MRVRWGACHGVVAAETATAPANTFIAPGEAVAQPISNNARRGAPSLAIVFEPRTGGPVMFTLFRSVPMRTLLATQAPALLLSFVIAELFYKFHSFTLECLAFLVTWFVISSLARWILTRVDRNQHRRL